MKRKKTKRKQRKLKGIK